MVTSPNIEVWKAVPGYEGAYEVSSHGRVRSLDRVVTVMTRWGKPADRLLRGRVLALGPHPCGYHTIHLAADGGVVSRTVHSLVAEVFLARPRDATCVNHIDGDKKNNHVSNLEWCTFGHNVRHAYAHGLMKPYQMAVIGTSLRDGSEVYFERQTDAEETLSRVGRRTGMICRHMTGLASHAYGYVWRAA